MDFRFSFEKRVIQLVVIGGVLLLSLTYIFSVEWLPTLRRKLQLQSEKYQHLKSLREKQEQQKKQEENEEEKVEESNQSPENIETKNASKKGRNLLLRSIQRTPDENTCTTTTTTAATSNRNEKKKLSDTSLDKHDGTEQRLSRVPLKKTSRDMTKYRQQPDIAFDHSAPSPVSPLVEGQDLRRAQDEEYQLSLLEEAAKREAEEQAAVEAAALAEMLKESVEIRRQELRDSLSEIEEETAASLSVVAITFRFKDEALLLQNQNPIATTTPPIFNPNPSSKNGRLTHRFSTTLPVQKLLDFIQARELQPLSAPFELNLSYPNRTISTKSEPARNNLTLAEMEITCDSVIWVTFPDP